MTITQIDSKKLTLFGKSHFTLGEVYSLDLTLPMGRLSRRIKCRVKVTSVKGDYVSARFVALKIEDLRFLKELHHVSI